MVRSIFLILIYLFLISNFESINCQTKQDSLNQILHSSGDLTTKIEASLKLARTLLNQGNAETRKYLEIANRLITEQKDSLYFAKLYKIYAQYYVYTGNYEKATEYFLSTIKICRSLNNQELLDSALNGLAQLNIRTKNYEKGISIFEQLLKKAKENKNTEDIVLYSLNLAVSYGEAGNLNKAEHYLIQVFNSNPKNKFYKAVAANNLSFIYNNSKDYKKAVTFAKVAVKFSENFPDKAFEIESLTNYSNALRGLGNYAKAERIIRKTISLAKENNYIRKMNNAIGNLALNYEAMGNFRLAYKHYKDFAERRDSLLNESTNAKINELQIKYETEKKDRIITEKTEALERKNQALLFTGAGVVLFVFLSIVIYSLYRKKNEAYKALVKKNLEIISSEERYNLIKQKDNKQEKYSSSPLSVEKKEDINKLLEEAINEEKIFLNPDITLGKLAQKLGVNSKYLSQVIHEYYNSGFADFINHLRVKEAARLLSSNSYRHLSIEGISEMVGFKNKSSFNIYFKKFMNVTPSFFSRTSANLNS